MIICDDAIFLHWTPSFSVTTDELVAKEAVYHAIEDVQLVSTTVKEKVNQKVCFVAFDVAEYLLLNLCDHPDVVQFKTVTTFVNNE